MKAFWEWMIKNLSNIFGLIGILLTLYFGVFYVPSWLREAQQEKFMNAERNLQQSIKELIYFDSTCTYSEIKTLIKAKELSLNQSYPLTDFEVLTKTQESFMQDRFLPLERRKELISKIDVLKRQIPKPEVKQQEKAKSEESSWLLELLSIVFTIIAAISGTISFYLKAKSDKDKDEEIENQIIENEITTSSIELAINYEKQIISAINDLPNAKIIRVPDSKRDFKFDLQFLYEGKSYFIEVKYLTRNKVNLNSFMKFLALQKGLEGEFWFIYNTDVTEMVRAKVEQMNKLTGPSRKITLIRAENGSDFKNKVKKLLSIVE